MKSAMTPGPDHLSFEIRPHTRKHQGGNLGALILTGPPGVGKTTVAGRLVQRAERSVHLEADRFFFINSGSRVQEREGDLAL